MAIAGKEAAIKKGNRTINKKKKKMLNDLFVRIGNGELLEFSGELREHNFASKVINWINSRSMRINFRILKFPRISKYLIYPHYEFIQVKFIKYV